jgi:hypothetical protein
VLVLLLVIVIDPLPRSGNSKYEIRISKQIQIIKRAEMNQSGSAFNPGLPAFAKATAWQARIARIGIEFSSSKIAQRFNAGNNVSNFASPVRDDRTLLPLATAEFLQCERNWLRLR